MSHKPQKGRPLGSSRIESARNGPPIPLFAVAIGVLVVVLIAAGIVIAVVGGDDDSTQAGTLAPGDQAFGPVSATGNPLPEFPGGAAEDAAVGMPAPELVGETPSGEAITIDPAEGPLVVVFLAHWCPHCQAEVPRLVELADDEGEIDGVPFVAVLTGSDPNVENFPPGEWLAREGWPADAMVDTQPESGQVPVALSTYGLSGYPFLVGIDADGNVAARASGELGDEGLQDFFALVAGAA